MKKLGFLVLIAALCLCGRAWAATDPPISDTYKSETDASGHKDAIAGAIKTEVAKLLNNDDTQGQSDAREWLQKQAVLNSRTATSSSYIDVYADALNQQLAPIVKSPDAPPRARLNAVMIAGNVSEAGGSSNLMPTIRAALADSNEAMVLAGERAAGQVMMPVLKNPTISAQTQKDLLDAVVAGVANHATGSLGGDIADDAYSALKPPPIGTTLSPAALSRLADAVIALQQTRVKLYATGIPDGPNFDSYASLFLLDPTRWSTLTPAQQLAAGQNAVDLVFHAGQRARELPTNEASELIKAINNVGGCLSRLVSALNEQNLLPVMQRIEKLPVGSAINEINDAVNPVLEAAKQVAPSLKDLKQPATLGPKKPHT